MPLRKVSAKDEHVKRLKLKYEQVYKEFQDYAEMLSIKQGKMNKNSGKADSYARYLIYLSVLYEENFNEAIGDLNTGAGLTSLEKVRNMEEFKAYNRQEKNFPSATISCYTSFIQSKEEQEVDAQLFTDEEDIMTNTELLAHISNFISSKSFLYSKQNITNLYISLRTKPFVILSGISGTGKTKIVQLFANAVGANYDNGRYRLISVRPNWSDSSDLLGYTDLKGDFVYGQLTDMIIRATNDPEHPHFVVLDEMNLARVEYYLSDYLSVIESRDRQGDKLVTAPIVEVKLEDSEEKTPYGLPDNLYIIGTVNMDETTHPFSKKVLDRANSIEFNDIHLTSYNFLVDSPQQVSSKNVSNKHFVSEYLYFNEIYPQHKEIVEKASTDLESINEQLQKIYAQVGYRVRDEICFYMIYAQDTDLTEEEAMDFCIMQKILPRISGAGPEMEKILEALYKDFTGVAYAKDQKIPDNAQYPRSAKKLAEMRKRLSSQGFTSFWVS